MYSIPIACGLLVKVLANSEIIVGMFCEMLL
jgi:hypothetical protein